MELPSPRGEGGGRGNGRVLCRDRVSPSVTEDQIDEERRNTKGRFDQTAEKELLGFYWSKCIFKTIHTAEAFTWNCRDTRISGVVI